MQFLSVGDVRCIRTRNSLLWNTLARALRLPLFACLRELVVWLQQDLDSGHHGSGFPLPPFRAALLRAHLAAQERSKPKAVSAAAAAPATAAKEPTNGLAPDAGDHAALCSVAFSMSK